MKKFKILICIYLISVGKYIFSGSLCTDRYDQIMSHKVYKINEKKYKINASNINVLFNKLNHSEQSFLVFQILHIAAKEFLQRDKKSKMIKWYQDSRLLSLEEKNDLVKRFFAYLHDWTGYNPYFKSVCQYLECYKKGSIDNVSTIDTQYGLLTRVLKMAASSFVV